MKAFDSSHKELRMLRKAEAAAWNWLWCLSEGARQDRMSQLKVSSLSHVPENKDAQRDLTKYNFSSAAYAAGALRNPTESNRRFKLRVLGF